MTDTRPANADIEAQSAWVPELERALGQVLVGQQRLAKSLTLGLLTGGHVLLEGVPGLAKSLAVSCLAKAVHGTFSRLQFTPDLLPSDLVGTEIYNAKESSFSVRRGPIFANFVLADEINRAPAKVQSALLEAMQEGHVSIGGETMDLPKPFLVLATQNPIEQEGTYPLPEAQLDRFALKVVVDYPKRDEELMILDRMSRTAPKMAVPRVVELATIEEARRIVDRIELDPRLAGYIVDLVQATRDPKNSGLADLATRIQYGASPRATIWLALAARAHAFLERRGFVTPTDIKAVALEVLRHRVLPTFEAEAEGLTADDLVQRILDTVPLP
ncbi:MAG: MoxR family ATPase [Planctomycetes bacterium]|nr:MoxR family ATPase [Planctomycetota bacterium]MCB9912374.1 MoxR family ATPase [Planctomycetota bacterium]HRV82146.1 MoxR family ATPase [Planctomycetota bacterium]